MAAHEISNVVLLEIVVRGELQFNTRRGGIFAGRIYREYVERKAQNRSDLMAAHEISNVLLLVIVM